MSKPKSSKDLAKLIKTGVEQNCLQSQKQSKISTKVPTSHNLQSEENLSLQMPKLIRNQETISADDISRMELADLENLARQLQAQLATTSRFQDKVVQSDSRGRLLDFLDNNFDVLH